MKPLLLISLALFGIYMLSSVTSSKSPATTLPPTAEYATATFAGGCFWCMEPPFDRLEGVISTISGYMGGHVDQPTYQQVSAGGSGHAEVVQITYDPSLIDYTTLLHNFWRNIDPTDANGQFCDKGRQYRSEIFYHNTEQRDLAEQSKTALNNKPFTGKITTDITSAATFYPAEQYHQNYYQKNPISYKYYRYACGRDKRLEQLWGTQTTTTDH
jgi:peptide-methionine (S)-S-oxide reductase